MGRIKKYGPDVLELVTGLGSVIPNPFMNEFAAANTAARAFRSKLNNVPNEEVRDK